MSRLMMGRSGLMLACILLGATISTLSYAQNPSVKSVPVSANSDTLLSTQLGQFFAQQYANSGMQG